MDKVVLLLSFILSLGIILFTLMHPAPKDDWLNNSRTDLKANPSSELLNLVD